MPGMSISGIFHFIRRQLRFSREKRRFISFDSGGATFYINFTSVNQYIFAA
ncbi:hypothetical protein FHS68_005253 [Dyadobacter arcticus]|uniref:Uncharacterized protein n=1 Tax=Dyadobacter arcticus TaxID=1078754 RepID=A0ABX0USW1_9BACT|nr:hypothetical protein [Dyadobacter arcticus]